MNNPIFSYDAWHLATFGTKPSPANRIGTNPLDVGLRDGYEEADALWLEAVEPLVEAARAFIDAQEAWSNETPRPADTGPSTICIEMALAPLIEEEE